MIRRPLRFCNQELKNVKHIHIGFSIHRPEMIPKTAELMGAHDVIFLEEPPDPGFGEMLAGNISIEAYLMPQDLEYPDFSRQMAALEKELHHAGKKLIQVEPFYAALLSIHDTFADGGTPDDLKPKTLPFYVFMAERQATGALLKFYQTAATGSFDAVIQAVREFSKTDARRFRLRDSLRAQEIARQAAHFTSVYVEAGTIHFFLFRELHRLLSDRYRVRPVYLDRLVLSEAGHRQHLYSPVYSPGDLLTLFYILHPGRARRDTEDLLAARSVIYSKIIHKQENKETGNLFFHLKDEMACIRRVKNLSVDNCRELFGRVRNKPTDQARQVVERYQAGRTEDDNQG